MTVHEIYEKLQAGERIRLLPKSVVFNRVRGEDSRILFVGPVYFRGEKEDETWDALAWLEKSNYIRLQEESCGIGTYVLTGKPLTV